VKVCLRLDNRLWRSTKPRNRGKFIDFYKHDNFQKIKLPPKLPPNFFAAHVGTDISAIRQAKRMIPLSSKYATPPLQNLRAQKFIWAHVSGITTHKLFAHLPHARCLCFIRLQPIFNKRRTQLPQLSPIAKPALATKNKISHMGFATLDTPFVPITRTPPVFRRLFFELSFILALRCETDAIRKRYMSRMFAFPSVLIDGVRVRDIQNGIHQAARIAAATACDF